MSNIELCRSHVDFSDEGSFEETVGIYRSAGVNIVSTGVNAMAGDEQEERKLFEFVKLAGARFMSVSFNLGSMPDCLRVAEGLAEEYDVRLGIHNHGGRHWLGNVSTLSWVLSQTSSRIGLSLDTGWAIDAGEDPVKMIEDFPDRVYGIHFKDFTFDSARTPKPVTAGTGALDLQGVLKALEAVGFEGFAVVEHEGDANDPVSDVMECARAIRAG
jgi:sugar phosphate isomerase/epimerase